MVVLCIGASRYDNFSFRITIDKAIEKRSTLDYRLMVDSI